MFTILRLPHDRPLAVKASISSGLGFIVGLLDF